MKITHQINKTEELLDILNKEHTSDLAQEIIVEIMEDKVTLKIRKYTMFNSVKLFAGIDVKDNIPFISFKTNEFMSNELIVKTIEEVIKREGKNE